MVVLLAAAAACAQTVSCVVRLCICMRIGGVCAMGENCALAARSWLKSGTD